MRPGQIGGLLLIGGCVLFAVAMAIAATGGAVGLGVIGASGTVVLAALILGGLGCAVIAIQGPPPVCGPGIRASLGVVAAGLLSLCLGSALAGASPTDPLASGPIVALIGVGLVAALLGIIATGVTLVVAPWSPRLPGIVVLVGILCLGLVVVIGSPSDGTFNPRVILGGVGLIAILLGGVWIGVTAFRGEGAPAAS